MVSGFCDKKEQYKHQQVFKKSSPAVALMLLIVKLVFQIIS